MLIIVLDTIAFLSAITALFLLVVRRKRIPEFDIRILLTLLFTSTIIYFVFLLIEWIGISHSLEQYEDFIGAIIPMLWAFVFYAYIQRGITRDLIKSEDNTRVTLHSIADGVISTTHQGKISRMNPTAEKLTGWTWEKAKGKPLMEVFNIINTSTRESETNLAEKVQETGDIVRLSDHTTLISKTGAEYQIEKAASPIRNTDGEILGIVIVFRDVTEEYRLRHQILENEKRMDLALKSADLGTWDWNVKTGDVIFNQRWAEMLGYTLDEIKPRLSTWEELIHPDDFKSVMKALNDHLEGKTYLYETEHRLKHKNGQWIWLLDKGRVIERDSQGKPVRACGTHLDINERKRNHERIRQIQKIEAVGRLAGGVAHDLNNLLSPIIGYCELLSQDTDLNNKSQKYLNEILNAGFRARELVHQLLAFCRKQVMEFKPVDINKTINNFKNLLQRTIPEDIAIKIIPFHDIQPVLADVGQIEQIIMNLSVNAADAMPDGGELTIETSVTEIDSSFAAAQPDIKPGTYVMLSFSDNGCGMDPETRDRIFEPFYSTKGEQGTGLGLSTVYGIVKQHEGHIWLYSEPGQGTTFKIYLPVTKESLNEEEKSGSKIDKIKATETVLLTEDDNQVRTITKAILERQGFTVLAANSGDDALSVLSSHQGDIHLLLTDVIMPGMNGRELFKRAIQKYPDMKVLFMSGYTDNIISHRGVLDRNFPFIQKPFSANGLFNKIIEVLNGEKINNDNQTNSRTI